MDRKGKPQAIEPFLLHLKRERICRAIEAKLGRGMLDGATFDFTGSTAPRLRREDCPVLAALLVVPFVAIAIWVGLV